MIDRDIMVNAIAGALLVAVSGYLSKYYSGYLSGLLYGISPFAAYYLYFYSIYVKKDKKNGFSFINGTIVGGILWLFLVMLLYPLHYLLFR